MNILPIRLIPFPAIPFFVGLAAMVSLTAGPCRAASASSSLLCLNANGSVVACTNRDSGTVAVFSGSPLQRTLEVELGLHPEGCTFVGSTSLVACCVYGADEVVVVDTQTGKVAHRIAVFDEPYGIVSSADGRHLYVTLEYPGQIVRIRTTDWTIDAEWNVGKMPRGIALSADQKSLFVTEYLTANVLQVSTDSGEVVHQWPGASTDNLARQIVLHPSLPKAYVPHIRSRITAAHGNGSIFPYVGVLTLSGEDGGSRTRIPMDTFRGTRVVANPWEVALSPDGSMLYVAFSGTNDLYAARIVNDNHQELEYAATLKLGSNPRALRVTPDGKSLLVYNALDFELVRYRLPDLAEVERVSVTDHPLEEPLRLGKMLFYTALQPMSGRQWISCSSCHPDGDADGRTWQQPEGLRQTQPLFGLAWTHPLHWSADRDEVQDFEHTVRGKLMQGRGLMKGALPDALGDQITGRSQMLDALAAYTNSHHFTLSPHAKNGLSEAAQRGQAIFHSSKTRCAECHSGAYYCDSQPGDAAAFRKHNVGTGEDDASELMGPEYDTPTLLGVYRSAPYLHHGKATTLLEVLTVCNKDDRHGVTSHLSDSERNDLVEFLKSLPFEDPEPAARQQQLRQVTGLSANARP
ncbi:MAG: beta-propeller fold lactonase family protein [Planctomycetaceae bacterium]|nr:beta-propeller fold lactonase family protein [Planctomycetaceae bacterium]